MKYFFGVLFSALLLIGCGGAGSVDPDAYLEERTAQAITIDNYIGAHLAYKSLGGYKQGEAVWNVQVGYMNGKPAVVKMLAADNRQQTWWIYPDSTTGKAIFLKEETKGKDGKGVRNLFAYKDTSLIIAKAGLNPYQPENDKDFRMKFAEVNKLMQEVLAAVVAERTDLSKAANEARNANAQFFAAGNEPGWSLVINPSLNEIVFTEQAGPATQKFSYASPDAGPMGESVYELRTLEEKLKITIVSKYCVDASGKVYPYSVAIESKGKSFTGCGILLQ